MKILNYDGKRYASITDEEAEAISRHKGMHIVFKGNLMKMSKIEVFDDNREGVEGVTIHMKSTEELKEIIGEFENQLNEHKTGFPKNPLHPEIRKRGLLPDCGSGLLIDQGIVAWYVENGWIFTENPKEGERREWAITMKYVHDGVSEKEEALGELIHRREYMKSKEEESFNKITVPFGA